MGGRSAADEEDEEDPLDRFMAENDRKLKAEKEERRLKAEHDRKLKAEAEERRLKLEAEAEERRIKASLAVDPAVDSEEESHDSDDFGDSCIFQGSWDDEKAGVGRVLFEGSFDDLCKGSEPAPKFVYDKFGGGRIVCQRVDEDSGGGRQENEGKDKAVGSHKADTKREPDAKRGPDVKSEPDARSKLEQDRSIDQNRKQSRSCSLGPNEDSRGGKQEPEVSDKTKVKHMLGSKREPDARHEADARCKTDVKSKLEQDSGRDRDHKRSRSRGAKPRDHRSRSRDMYRPSNDSRRPFRDAMKQDFLEGMSMPQGRKREDPRRDATDKAQRQVRQEAAKEETPRKGAKSVLEAWKERVKTLDGKNEDSERKSDVKKKQAKEAKLGGAVASLPKQPDPLPDPLPPGDRKSLTLTIPTVQIGILVGKGGDRLGEIRSRSQSEIEIHQNGTEFAQIIINGNAELAQALIFKALQEKLPHLFAPSPFRPPTGPDGKPLECQGKLYVGDLPHNVVHELLWTEFSKYGVLGDVFVKPGCEVGRQWAFISFVTMEHAQHAKSMCDRKLWLPGSVRPVSVMFARVSAGQVQYR